MFTAHECFKELFEQYSQCVDEDGVRISETTIGGFGIMSAVLGTE